MMYGRAAKTTKPFALLFSLLLTPFLFIPMSTPIRGQSSSLDADVLLRKCIAETFSGSASVTGRVKRSNRMVLREQNMSVHQTSNATLRYDPPFVSIRMTTEMSLDRGGGTQRLKKQSTRLLQHLNQENRCFLKIGSNAWEPCSNQPVSERIRKKFLPFYQPEQFLSFFKSVTVTGTETDEHQSYTRISGSMNLARVGDYVESHVRSVIGGSPAKTTNVDVTSANLSFLVTENPYQVHRIKLGIDQKMTVEAGPAGDQTLTIERHQEQRVTYMNHGTTRIHDRERKRLEKAPKQETPPDAPKGSEDRPDPR